MQANDVRRGTALMIKGAIHIATEVTHRTPGNLRAFVQMTLKNVMTGEQIQSRFSSTEDVEQVYLEPRQVQFLYADAQGYHFMDLGDYNTLVISEDFVGDDKYYLKENMEVDLDVYNGKPVRIRLPKQVVLKIVESPPWVKGDSVSNNTKPAKTETGLQVNVPIFVGEGQLIRVDTESGKYLGRE
jgi:elongation factor P